MNKFRKFIAKHSDRSFLIEEDFPENGFVVYAFDDRGITTHDYLQDDLEMAKLCAFDNWGVPYDAWRDIDTLDGTGLSLHGTTG